PKLGPQSNISLMEQAALLKKEAESMGDNFIITIEMGGKSNDCVCSFLFGVSIENQETPEERQAREEAAMLAAMTRKPILASAVEHAKGVKYTEPMKT